MGLALGDFYWIFPAYTGPDAEVVYVENECGQVDWNILAVCQEGSCNDDGYCSD